jgi:hypothetical protein
VGGSLTLFHAGDQLEKQYKKGRMGEAAGFEWRMDQNVATHTVGALGGTPVVKTTVAAQGASAIAVTGGSNSISGYLKAGDVITIAGVYALNPQSKQSTGSLQQFVVTADSDTDGSGEIAALGISPAIQTTGQYANCSALPIQNAVIQVFGHASSYANKVSPANLAYHRDAFVLGMADLDLPGGVDMAARASDPDAGLSLRIVRAYDINNDVFPCRVDVLYGWKAIYPELACRVHG